MKPRERGATMLMVTFVAAFLLIPIIGTCIDGAVVYWVKARLSAAVDSAALATARALNIGVNNDQQVSNATLVGQSYFAANFAPGLMQTTIVGGAPNIWVDPSVPHERVVNVSATITVPLFFMPLLGFKTETITASGQATRRDANVMMVLDRSNSMNPHAPNNVDACSLMRAAALNFVTQFAAGRDQVGLVTFQTGANLDYQPTTAFDSNPTVSSTLANLQCAGDTSTAQGLYLAWDQIENYIKQPNALNVILLFTDGSPNGLVAPFTKKFYSDTRYDAVNTSNLVPMGPSNCSNSGSWTGVIADGSTETSTSVAGMNATGYTVAILNSTGVAISDTSSPTTISHSGCAFQDWNTSIYGREDIAAIPPQDAFGNSTLDRGIVGVPTLDVFPSSNTNYSGQIRPDMPRTVRWASFNAADSMAQTIRNNSTYGTYIYTIGLEGNETMLMNQDFMMRLANQQGASNFDSTKPQGKFIYITDPSQLTAAFQQVAWQIFRLSK